MSSPAIVVLSRLLDGSFVLHAFFPPTQHPADFVYLFGNDSIFIIRNEFVFPSDLSEKNSKDEVLQSYLGMLQHGNAQKLRQELFKYSDSLQLPN